MSYVALGKLLNFSVPQFPLVLNDTNYTIYLTELLWGFNEWLHLNSAQKHRINRLLIITQNISISTIIIVNFE